MLAKISRWVAVWLLAVGGLAALAARPQWMVKWRTVCPTVASCPLRILPDGLHVIAPDSVNPPGHVLVNLKTGGTEKLSVSVGEIYRLAWSSSREQLALVTTSGSDPSEHRVWVAGADLSKPRLTYRARWKPGLEVPDKLAWLQNDTWLIYTWPVWQGGKVHRREGRVVKLDGLQERPALKWEAEAVWSEKMGRGAWVHNGTIEVRSFGTDQVRRYGPPGPGRYEALDFSDDGRYIAYARYHGKPYVWPIPSYRQAFPRGYKEFHTPGGVWLLDTVTGKHRPIVSGTYFRVFAEFSPDRDRLACILWVGDLGDGVLSEACTASLHSGAARFLPDYRFGSLVSVPPRTRGDYDWVDWSFDGQFLMAGTTADHSAHTWVFDRNGKPLAALEQKGWGSGECGPAWLPTGNQIAGVMYKHYPGGHPTDWTLFVATLSRAD